MKPNKYKLIERNIRLAWSSLESHLWGIDNKTPEGKKFHRDCCREYAEQIMNLTKLL